MPQGTVKWFNTTKGYGFIQPEGGGKDVFVHISAVERAGLRTLNEGQHVSFELKDERGKTAAVDLKAAARTCSSTFPRWSGRVCAASMRASRSATN